MPNTDFFDSNYVNSTDNTNTLKKQSEVKTLLKETTKEKEMDRYGTSKPKRVVIKAKITNG